jgi:hypothetical protein
MSIKIYSGETKSNAKPPALRAAQDKLAASTMDANDGHKVHKK